MKRVMIVLMMAMMATGCATSGGYSPVANGGSYNNQQAGVAEAAVKGVIGQAVNTTIIEVNTEVQYRIRRGINEAFGR